MAEEDPLNSKITAWLNEQGYPLEMRVASTLQQCGYRVVQSEYFSDPETGDSRELDVVAFKQKKIQGVLFRISILIECKRSTDKPWILFTSAATRLADPARVAQRAANSLGRLFLYEAATSLDLQGLSLFSVTERPGYGVTQAFTSGKDVCYSSVTSVSKAALATAAKLDKQKEEDGSPFRTIGRASDFCSILFPVVVVDGRLFEVFLDGAGVCVEGIGSGVLLWRNPMVGMPHTIINIVDAISFDTFAKEASSSIDKLFEMSGNQLSEAFQKAIEKENRPPIRTKRKR